ncbi:Gfo/Idh/MocA family oxidoreductase [Streptomyces sp. NPDC042319]|uniref:Gfo/Idh/MocA family protein n=1 Tax=Streptomyces sp. NPDC042319 TaxID=3154332 RepID=UPI0033D8B91C
MTGPDQAPATATAPAPAVGRRPTGSPLRFAVLGTGYWARWCHGTVLAERPDVDFIGFWGRDGAKAEHAAADVGRGRGFADLDALLDAVDAVAIALPPDVQAPLAVRAARAGKHLLLDKPLALDVPAADDVVRAVAESGVISLSFMTFLFQKEVAAWLDRMRTLAAAHGPWEGVSVSCAGSIDTPGSPYAASAWRRERGGLWDWGPHALSLILSLLPPVERVAAVRGMRDTVHMGNEHIGGPVSSLTLTVTAPEKAQESVITVWGPAGRESLRLPTGTLREACHRAVDQFQEAVAGHDGRAHPLDAAYARNIVAVLDAAERQLALPAEKRATTPAQ